MPETQESPEPKAAKQPLKRQHLWLLDSYSVISLLDCSAYPALKLADLLALPTAEVIRKHGIA